MSNLIKECEDLVDDGIPNEFKEADATMIGKKPEVLVKWGPVTLCGQHTGPGYKSINLRLPGLKQWLRKLASSGIGPADEYQAVRYKFIDNTRSDTDSDSSVSSL
ncbi:hypothetical protein ONS96_009465 [Cadophora gregata f. sp. sojae]|nr:hypothetical protein ONS96_009465 [Cadophora gregata f. sp. sojae]